MLSQLGLIAGESLITGFALKTANRVFHEGHVIQALTWTAGGLATGAAAVCSAVNLWNQFYHPIPDSEKIRVDYYAARYCSSALEKIGYTPVDWNENRPTSGCTCDITLKDGRVVRFKEDLFHTSFHRAFIDCGEAWHQGPCQEKADERKDPLQYYHNGCPSPVIVINEVISECPSRKCRDGTGY